jgi:uncharacterized protein
MTTTLSVLLTLQVLLGGFDNLWHHELQAKLPQRPPARRELRLHAVREAIYAVVFIGLAWCEWHGGWAIVLALLLVVECGVTLADFLEEDRSRQLPALERALHTLLTIGYGLFLGLFAPRLIEWAMQPSALVFSPHGLWSWWFTLAGLGVLAWSVRNLRAARSLAAVEMAPASPAAPCRVTPAVLITGGTGFIGRAFVDRLRRDGQRVIVLSRDLRQARATFGAGVWVVDELEAIPSETRIDAIVNLAGARVLGLPWTAARRRTLLASRIGTTAALVALMRRLQQPPRVFVSASAVGYYGASPRAELFDVRDERSPPRPGEFQSDLCAAIEHEARRAEALGVRVVRLRLGIVLGRGDGAYPLQALAARLGLGAVLGSGWQPVPWIHLADAIGLIRFAITHPHVAGALNAVAPDVPAQLRFVQTLAASFGRGVFLKLPAAPLRWAAGEMATLLLDGQNAQPRAALAAGYRFRFATLDAALRELAARRTPMSSLAVRS